MKNQRMGRGNHETTETQNKDIVIRTIRVDAFGRPAPCVCPSSGGKCHRRGTKPAGTDDGQADGNRNLLAKCRWVDYL